MHNKVGSQSFMYSNYTNVGYIALKLKKKDEYIWHRSLVFGTSRLDIYIVVFDEVIKIGYRIKNFLF